MMRPDELRRWCLALLVLVTVAAIAGCGGGGGGSAAPSAGGMKWENQNSPNPPALATYGAEAQFTFPTADGVHYLVRHDAPVGGILQASVTVETSGAPRFDFHTNPDNTCPDPSSYGLYFERSGDVYPSAPDGKFEFYRWWSTKRVVLAEGTTALLGDLNDPSTWISVYGKSGRDYPQQFRDAVANMGAKGFTFGGGCFYGHGVFVTPGSGSAVFKINAFQ
jgi:hypothetical protein